TVIGAAVNLSAKLEKYNKILGTKGLTTQETYTAAIAQGYEPQTETASVETGVEGTQGLHRLVVMHR
ncbi:MAG: adenylate/guanylate cyclase domain-containing protein, partial [Alphaproteobacteria bacterium]